MEAGRKLNLGCGAKPLEGYENWDAKTNQMVYPLDGVDDNSLKEIRASHVLEHLGHGTIGAVVQHWVQKLQPGGTLKIAVPDFEQVARRYLAGEPIDVQGYVMGGQTDALDYHAAIFDREALVEVMLAAGLERIREWSDDAGDCASLPISLNIEGRKPVGALPDTTGVVAVLPTARFGPALHHRCVYEALGNLRIPVTVVSSCFWHQHLSEMMETAIAKPETRWVLTLDFDSMFSALDVIDLLRLVEACPWVDAICPLQMKRDCKAILAGSLNGQGLTTLDLERSLVEVASGHFGLTLLRADALRELPRPWMQPKPNAEGRWAEGKTDADIAFWEHWRAQGRNVYLAPRVRIGHLVELVVWPGPGGQPVYQSQDGYQRQGMPQEVCPR